MSEIPKDVMDAARLVFDALNSPYRENPNTVDSDFDDDRHTIARAIIAERKRCAEHASGEIIDAMGTHDVIECAGRILACINSGK